MGDHPVSGVGPIQTTGAREPSETVEATPVSSGPSSAGSAVTTHYIMSIHTALARVGTAVHAFFHELPSRMWEWTPPADRPRLLSSTEGRITEIVMAYGGLAMMQGQLALLQQRPDIPRVTWLTAHASDCVSVQWFLDQAQIPRVAMTCLAHQEYGSRAVSHPVLTTRREEYQYFLGNFAPWTQDPWHIVQQGGRRQVLLAGGSMSARNLYYLHEVLCRDGAYACGSGPSLEGADVLASDGALFVTATYREPGENFRYAQVDELMIAAAFGTRNITWVGDPQRQAAFVHLDYLFTPMGIRDAHGRPVVAVGDMRMAIELLAATDEDFGLVEYRWGARDQAWETAYAERAPYYARMYEQARRLYGPTREDVMGVMMSTLSGQRLGESTEGVARYRHVVSNAVYAPWALTAAMSDQLDAIAEQMAAQGFAVVRVPYLDTKHRESPAYPILSYNNVLVEVYRDAAGLERRVVTMPTYDLPTLDNAAQAAYEQLGFTVLPVRGFLATTTQNGSLHCVVKVMERTEDPFAILPR